MADGAARLMLLPVGSVKERQDKRRSLATIYMFGKFAGAGAMAWLAGLAWSIGGWSAVCALGALLAATAAVVAWVGVGRTAS